MKFPVSPAVLLWLLCVPGCAPADREKTPTPDEAAGPERPRAEARRPETQPAEPARKTPQITEKGLVEAIRAEKDVQGLDERFARAIRRVDQLGGRLEFDPTGSLIGLDLTAERRAASNADLALLTSLPHLRKLKLSGGEITNQGVKHIGTMTGLVELALQNTQMDNDGLGQLTNLARLRSLDIRSTVKVDDAGLEHLKDLPELTHLYLLDNNFTDNGLATLKGLEGLELIDLRGCSQVGEAGLQHLRKLKNLKCLRLRGPVINNACMAALGQLSRLSSLTIEEAMITDDGLVELKNLPLEDITLFRCYGITDDGLRHFKNFQNLRRLSLRGIPLTGSGLVHLGDRQKLRILNLIETGVDDDALEHIKQLQGLVRLELRQTRITDAGLEIIAGLPNLEYLDIEDNRITDAGVAHLVGLSKLEALNLSLNGGVTDASVKHLTKLTNLKSLSVGQTAISEDGAGRLKEALPDCDITRL